MLQFLKTNTLTYGLIEKLLSMLNETASKTVTDFSKHFFCLRLPAKILNLKLTLNQLNLHKKKKTLEMLPFSVSNK